MTCIDSPNALGAIFAACVPRYVLPGAISNALAHNFVQPTLCNLFCILHILSSCDVTKLTFSFFDSPYPDKTYIFAVCQWCVYINIFKFSLLTSDLPETVTIWVKSLQNCHPWQEKSAFGYSFWEETRGKSHSVTSRHILALAKAQPPPWM